MGVVQKIVQPLLTLFVRASAGFGLSSSTVTIKVFVRILRISFVHSDTCLQDSSAEQCSGFGLGVRNGGVATVSNMQVTDCRDIGVYVSEGRLTGEFNVGLVITMSDTCFEGDAVSVSQSKRCGIAVTKGGEAVLSSCS